MANEGFGRDSLLKMVHSPGSDWHPGKGNNPRYDLEDLTQETTRSGQIITTSSRRLVILNALKLW